MVLKNESEEKIVTEQILDKLFLIPAILIGFTFHEFAHAIVADRLGDKTPKFQGRLTLNPLAHIDIMGFVMILIFGFGWAKPVEVNVNAFKHKYKDDLKVSLAGPVANIIVAFGFSIIFVLFIKFFDGKIDAVSYKIIISILLYTININIVLFIFNLIPVPGLDGFHILRDLFPKTFYNISGSIYRYQFIILILLVFVSPYIFKGPVEAIMNLFIYKICGAML